MAVHAVTALRLRLPCPNCDELFSTTAYAEGARVALSCTQCGYGWVESAQLDAALAHRAASFCADMGDPLPPPAATPMAPAEFPMTLANRRFGREN